MKTAIDQEKGELCLMFSENTYNKQTDKPLHEENNICALSHIGTCVKLNDRVRTM